MLPSMPRKWFTQDDGIVFLWEASVDILWCVFQMLSRFWACWPYVCLSYAIAFLRPVDPTICIPINEGGSWVKLSIQPSSLAFLGGTKLFPPETESFSRNHIVKGDNAECLYIDLRPLKMPHQEFFHPKCHAKRCDRLHTQWVTAFIRLNGLDLI